MQARHAVADFLSRVVLFILMLSAAVCVFGWYLPLIRVNQGLRQELAVQEERGQKLRSEINEMRRKLTSFRHDPATVERLARENLGYARPGETIIRFEN